MCVVLEWRGVLLFLGGVVCCLFLVCVCVFVFVSGRGVCVFCLGAWCVCVCVLGSIIIIFVRCKVIILLKRLFFTFHRLKELKIDGKCFECVEHFADFRN